MRSTAYQFGKPIFEFPRVADKLALMAAELVACPPADLFSARKRTPASAATWKPAWPSCWRPRCLGNADNAVQIHGGNGFALEYQISRMLCDARILNIFEGAGEIQAQVIARRLLETCQPTFCARSSKPMSSVGMT
jgi:(2S)-methylsuccinyl-CoA dehydrogenase